MSQTYWINKANNTYYLHFKIDQPAGSQVTWTITKDDTKAPELASNFWDFFEDFNNDTLDTSVWDASNYTANYSISDSNFNTWNNSGGCCNGSCYYTAVQTKQTFDLPLRVLIAANQDPYTSSTDCGKTAAFVLYGNSAEVITSTNTSDDACAYRVGNNGGLITGSTAIPNISPDYYQFITNFTTSGIEVDYHWWSDERAVITGTPTNTTGQFVGIGGDTDTTSTVDHIGYVAITTDSRDKMLTVTILEQADEYIKVQVDDSSTGNTVDYNNFIVTVKLPDGWMSSATAGLNIVNKTVYMLIENPSDNNVYTWDGSAWQNLNKTKDDLVADDFINSGVIAPLAISKSDLSSLNTTVNALYYCPDEINTINSVVKFLPYPRLITQKIPFNLKDYTVLNKFYNTTKSTSWSNQGFGFTVVVSRDNQNWFVWDTDNSTWKSLGTRTLDYLNPDDISWVNSNGTGIANYAQVTQEDWYSFFDNSYPDYLYLAIVLNYYEITDDNRLDNIYTNVNTRSFWQDVSSQHNIRFTENNISIQFNAGGTFKINYID